MSCRSCDTPPMSDPFSCLLVRATADPRVLGLILGGSRGKGFATERSDWDVTVVVADDVDPRAMTEMLAGEDDRLDLGIHTLDDFRGHTLAGDPVEWNAYNFAHVEPTLDRTGGLLKQLCQAKEWLPEDVAEVRARGFLGAYMNSYYRSLKNARDGNTVASRLDAAESVPWLLGLVFTAERRVRPYNKYLAWELARHPLSTEWWGAVPDPVAAVLDVTSSGGLEVQAALFRGVERRARTLGFGDALDGWSAPSLETMALGSAVAQGLEVEP